MNQSESIKSLLESLVKAQADFKTLPKDKEGYGYKYTDLDTVISTVRPILSKFNIGFMQTLTNVNGRDGLTTRVFNTEGEWIEDTFLLPAVAMAKTNAAQNVGAAITYMKRYALCAVLGISSDEDSDARLPPQQNDKQKKNPANPVPQQKGPMGGPDTPEQKAKIKELLATKSPSGVEIFANVRSKVGQWRKERTAEQVIKYLEEEKAKLIGEKFPEDIPYDESPLSAEEEAAASTAFETN